MSEYKRLTKRNPYATIRGTTFDILERLIDLENKIEDGELIFTEDLKRKETNHDRSNKTRKSKI